MTFRWEKTPQSGSSGGFDFGSLIFGSLIKDAAGVLGRCGD
jgi:hypothetical protein